MRHQPGDQGPDGDRRRHGDAERDLRRPDGDGDRPRRLGAAGARPQPGARRRDLERACRTIRDLAAGREVDLDGTPVQLQWSDGHELPIWVAAYGPKALRCAGRVADGVIMQLADPYIIEWSLRYLARGRRAGGPRPDDIKVMAAAPAYVSADLAHARDQVRWFPALVSNHVVDLVQRYHDVRASARADRVHRSPRALRLRPSRPDGLGQRRVRHRRGGRQVLRARHPRAGAGQAGPVARTWACSSSTSTRWSTIPGR